MPGTVRSIAVVVSGINQEYQSSVLTGAAQYAAEHGIRLCHFADMGGIIGSAAHDIGEYNIYRLIRYAAFDGLLLLGNTVLSAENRAAVFRAAKASGIPAVLVDAKEDFAASVCIDNYHAMRQVVEHMLDVHKCSRVFYLSGPAANPESADRLRAFRDVFAERGLSVPPKMIRMATFTSGDGTAAAESLLEAAKQGDPLPEAVVCANDIMAIAVMNTFIANGVRVPEDVRVTGFDHSFEGRNYEPELTSVGAQLTEEGKTAMELLCTGKATPGAVTMLHSQPFFSRSCGCKNSAAESEHRFKQVRFRQMERIAADTRLCNRLSCSFAECETPQAMMDVLAELILELNCTGFWFCLNSDWAGNPETLTTPEYGTLHEEHRIEGYPEQMHLLLAWENGERKNTCDFSVGEMLPQLAEKADPQNGGLFFLPVHFRSRTFGYCVLRGPIACVSSPLLLSLTITLGNALEHVRKVRCTNDVVDSLERLYILDALTGIYNRNGFARETREPYQQAIEQKKPVMVMFADLDGLKYINDHFGHSGGDTALRAVGRVLQQVCTHGEIFARFGGDEFLIFSVGAAPEQGASLTKAIQDALAKYNDEAQEPYLVSASIGYYIETPQPHTSVFQMVAEADARMYEKKKKRTPSKYLRKY